MYKAIVFDFGNTIAKSGSLANALEAVIVDEKAFAVGKRIEKEIGDLYKPDQKKQPEWKDIWARCFQKSGLPFSEGIGRRLCRFPGRHERGCLVCYIGRGGSGRGGQKRGRSTRLRNR